MIFKLEENFLKMQPRQCFLFLVACCCLSIHLKLLRQRNVMIVI